MSGARIILDGWAIRYRSLPDGRRQILAFLLPGDFCSMPASVIGHMDHSIEALTPVRYADFPEPTFHHIMATSPAVSDAVRLTILSELSIQREWTLSIGQRDARSRLAHLLCELVTRMNARGIGSRSGCAFPPRQSEIADALGLTPIHVNRTLMSLRLDNLIHLHGRELIIHDFDRLASQAMFDPSYLHLDLPRHGQQVSA